MPPLQVDDVLRELGKLEAAKADLLRLLARVHQDGLHLLVTSPKDPPAFRAAAQALGKTLVEVRRGLEAHGGGGA